MSTSTSMFVYAHINMCINTRVCICISLYVYMGVYAREYLQMPVQISVDTYICIHIGDGCSNMDEHRYIDCKLTLGIRSAGSSSTTVRGETCKRRSA